MDQTTPIARELAAASSRAGVRLLGRLLGDVIREQQGQSTFDQIEEIRSRSVGEHRRGEADAGAERGCSKRCPCATCCC